MVRWAEGVSRESIVLVEGVIQRPPPDQEDVHSTTIHQYEIKIAKVSPSGLTAQRPPLRSTPVACCIRAFHDLALPS